MEGNGWIVAFYLDARGRNPVLEFINSLPEPDQARVLRVLKLLQEFGPLLGMPHARPIEGKLWELRAGASRVFYLAYTGRQFVLLHGYLKKTQEAPRREIETARRRMIALMEDGL